MDNFQSANNFADPSSSDLVNTPEPSQPNGLLSVGEWFLASWALPCFSPSFYHYAARRRLGWAVAFFFVLGLTITVLQVMSATRGMVQAGLKIQNEYKTGNIPEIIIAKGVARVSGPQPLVLVNENRMLIVLDTTGKYTSIDRKRYNQGILLTRTNIAILNNTGRYQEMPLISLHPMLGDPFILNHDTVLRYWAMITIIGMTAVGLVLLVWNLLVRLAYLALLALPIWGVAVLIRRGIDFGQVFSVGLYALVPTLYLRFLLGMVNIKFVALFTILLLLIWIVALWFALMPRTVEPVSSSVFDYFRTERPLRAWRALLLLPMLVSFALEMIFSWNDWRVIWAIALVCSVLVLAVSVQPLVSKALKTKSASTSEPP